MGKKKKATQAKGGTVGSGEDIGLPWKEVVNTPKCERKKKWYEEREGRNVRLKKKKKKKNEETKWGEPGQERKSPSLLCQSETSLL